MEHTQQQQQQQHHACYGNQAQQTPQSLLAVTIVSASYAPCEGGGNDGEGRANNDGDPAVAAATSTRDVTPFVRALLLAQKKREDEAADDVSETGSRMWSGSSNHSIQLNAVVGGQQRAQIRILDESSLGMNGIFGDPAPGTSKRLHIHYIISEVTTTSSSSQVEQQPEHQGCRDRSWRAQHAATAQSHSVHFAEHERVYLRRRTTTGDHHRQTAETPLATAPDQHDVSEKDDGTTTTILITPKLSPRFRITPNSKNRYQHRRKICSSRGDFKAKHPKWCYHSSCPFSESSTACSADWSV